MVWSTNVCVQAILSPCPIDVPRHAILLNIGPSHPRLHAFQVEWDHLFFGCGLPATIESKLLKVFNLTRPLELVCVEAITRFLALLCAGEVDQCWVTTDFHARTNRSTTLIGAVHDADIKVVHVQSVEFSPGRSQVLAVSTPGGEEFDEPWLVALQLSIGRVLKVHNLELERDAIELLGFPISFSCIRCNNSLVSHDRGCNH